MANLLGIDNSIGWAHWQLKGGWKNMSIACFGYAVICGGLILMTIHTGRQTPKFTAETLSTWRMWLIAIHAALMTLFAGSRIAIAIRSDITSHMIESHALMPVPALTAVSGYIWGPTLQPIGLMLVNFALGLWVCKGAGMPTDVWTWPCIVIVEFAVFIWVTAAFASLTSRLGWGAVFAALIIVGFSLGAVAPMLPAVMVLCSPLIGRTVFQASSATFDLSPPLLGSLVAQACIGSILYVGAARKYRRSDQTALGVVPSFLLLVCWVTSSFVGLRYLDDFHSHMFGMRPDYNARSLFISAAASSMVLALIPIANSARERETRLGSLSPLIAIVAAIAIAPLCLVWYPFLDGPIRPLILTATVFASFLVSMCFILRITYRVTPRGWLIGLLWLLITWLVPILVDMALWALSDSDEVFTSTMASAMSPIGALPLIWDQLGRDYHVEIAVGTGVQLALAIGWMLLFHLTNRSRRVPIASTGALDQIREAVE